MKKNRLREGYTTGACAAAAARGAVLMLRDQQLHDEAEILFPGGELVSFRLNGQHVDGTHARCYVIKDAGDDPDVTHGAEIHAEVTLVEDSGGETVVIRGGTGIGRVTKPGLAVPPGEWAINPIPRKMITEAVNEVFSLYCPLLASCCPSLVPCVTISIPNGEVLAKKTLNERLGILGGLSILGTTGIVKPISGQAWTDTIDAALGVALASGCKTIVLSTGRTSETIARHCLATGSGHAAKPQCGDGIKKGYRRFFKGLSDESYVMMGDHVGHALRSCLQKGVRDVVLAAQFAKLLKIACGNEQTHVSSSRLDLSCLGKWLAGSAKTKGYLPHVLQATTARHVLETTGAAPEIVSLVCIKAARFAEECAPGLRVKVLLAGYGGEVLYFR